MHVRKMRYGRLLVQTCDITLRGRYSLAEPLLDVLRTTTCST